MIRDIANKSAWWMIDHSLGLVSIQTHLCRVFGPGQRGALLPLIRYRARFMVLPGETAVLVGIFSDGTVRRFLDAVTKTGMVVVIEANPANVARIQRRLGHRRNLIFVNKAVWTDRGTMAFIASDVETTQGYNRIKTSEIADYPYHMEQQVTEITVECDRLDAILKDLKLGRIDHINLTCNGAEVAALDSIQDLIRTQPHLRIYANTQAPSPYREYIDRLQEYGFKYHVTPVRKVRNKQIELNRVYAYLPQSDV